MLRSLRPTTPRFLTLLALGLAILLSVWCISQALYALAVLAAATTVVVLLLLRRQSRDAQRHRQALQKLQESEDRFGSVLAALPDDVLVVDAKGRYRNIFTAEENLLALPADRLLGRTIHEVLPPEAAGAMQDVVDRALRSGERQQYEYPLKTAGEDRWFSARVVPFGSPDDPCVLWVARDLTARKQAEEDLRKSEARFRQLAENLDQVIWLSTWTGREVAYVNRAYEKIWGRPRQSLYDHPQSWQDTIHPDDKERVVTAFERDVPRGRYDEEFRLLRDGKTVRWVRDRAFPIHDGQGRVYRIAGISEDITQRKLAEEKLRDSEEQFRSVVGMASDAVIVADERGIIRVWNEASEKIFGYAEAEAVGQPLTLIMPEEYHRPHAAGLKRLLDTGVGPLMGKTVELTGRRKDGSEFPVELSLTNRRTAKGLVFTAILRDITERKHNEEALRESEERLRQLTENINEVFWMTSGDLQEMIYVSPAYEEIWGRSCQSLYEDPTQWIKAIHEEDRERVERAYFAGAARGEFDEEYRIVRPDGSIRWIRDQAFPIFDDDGTVRRIAGIAEDITELAEHREHLEALVEERTAELRESHARLREADRLALIGTLAAGLGHDMNNVLFSVRCRFDAVDWKALSPQLRTLLEAARNSVDYLQRLCDGLRWLAVDPEDSQVSDDVTALGPWWERVEPVMSQMVPAHVTLETDLPADLPPVAVPAHRLTQAVMNLIVNAAEATRQRGTVRIWARPDDDRPTVHIGVTDEGAGMSEDVRRRAFDPFFTTKKRSLSTGLGLSLVHGVVAMSGGSASIETAPGQGTTVTLTLPEAPAEVCDEASPRRGLATISLADPLRAEWVAHVVRLAGYDVERSLNGEPAPGSRLWVTEPTAGTAAVRGFCEKAGGDVILLGAGGPEWSDLATVTVEDPGSLAAIRAAVQTVASTAEGGA